MFFEYEFAISEEDQTVENLRAAITQESQHLPQSGYPSVVENLLTAMKNQPIGTITLRLHEVVDGRPNVVYLSTGTKLFMFDPIARVVVFHMMTSSGRSVDLHLPLEKPAPDGLYFIALVWDTSKGARLHVNDRVADDGLQSKSGNATTTGNQSPAVTGDGNTITYGQLSDSKKPKPKP